MKAARLLNRPRRGGNNRLVKVEGAWHSSAMEGEKADFHLFGVSFGSAALANRRVAGVAAVARTAHDLMERGVAEICIVIEDGGTLNELAWRDVRRIAGAMPVAILGPNEPRLTLTPAPVLTSWDVLRSTGKPSDGLVARLLNRPISRCCSALLLKLPRIRPAHATVGTAAIAIVMFALFVLDGSAGLIVGALLFHAASVFDGVDGEIARATYRETSAGASFDSAIDIMTNLLFVLGLTINLTMRSGVFAAALGGWSLTMLAIGFWLIGGRNRHDQEPLHFEWLKQHVRRHPAETPMSRIAGLATFLTTRASIALFFMVMILAGLAILALCVLALSATIWISVLVVALATARRDGVSVSGIGARPRET